MFGCLPSRPMNICGSESQVNRAFLLFSYSESIFMSKFREMTGAHGSSPWISFSEKAEWNRRRTQGSGEGGLRVHPGSNCICSWTSYPTQLGALVCSSENKARASGHLVWLLLGLNESTHGAAEAVAHTDWEAVIKASQGTFQECDILWSFISRSQG